MARWRVRASNARAVTLQNNYSDSRGNNALFQVTKYIWFTLRTLHTEQRLESDLPSLHRSLLEILISVHGFG